MADDNLSSALRRGGEQARDPTASPKGGFGRLLKTIFYALIFAFAIGLLIGTLIRREIEKPVRYIGAAPAAIPETIFTENSNPPGLRA